MVPVSGSHGAAQGYADSGYLPVAGVVHESSGGFRQPRHRVLRAQVGLGSLTLSLQHRAASVNHSYADVGAAQVYRQ